MAQQKIGVILEVKDNGSMGVSTKNAKELRAAIEAGQKASILLSRGISDPKKEEALKAQVALAKQLTREINAASNSSRAAAKAMSALTVMDRMEQTIPGAPGLQRGSAAANARGGTRDFARQAQGMGGLVHVYATFAANIWAVAAAFEGLSRAFETTRLEESAVMLSKTMGASMVNLSKDLREASGQAVSFKESLQFSAMGTQAGLSARQLNSLVTAAKGAANVLGRDVNDAINRMIRGTVKMEQEILDELGIFVRAKQAYKEYATANNLAGEEALTQSERVQAYADAVEKASKKYAEFAKIKDPFSSLKTTIADAGTELLNFANKGITPIVQGLSDSKNLVEALLLGGGLYLTKLAIPAVKDFGAALFDTSKAQAAAASANKQALIDLEVQREKLLENNIGLSPRKADQIAKLFGEKLGTAISTDKITEKVQTALLSSVSAADFQQKMKTALESTARGKELAAGKAKDSGRAQALFKEAELIKQQSVYLSEVIAKDEKLVSLLNKKVKSSQDLAEIEKQILNIKERQGVADTAEQRRYDRQRTQGNLTNAAALAITSFGAGGSLKELGKYFDEAKTAAGRFGTAIVTVSTVVGLATKAVTALLGVFNWLLLGWLAVDLAIVPILNKFNLISNSAEKVEGALEKLGNQNQTTTATFEASNKLLSNQDQTLQDRFQAYSSLTNAIVEQKVAIENYNSTISELNNLTTLDKVFQSIKGVFTDNIFEKAEKQIQNTVQVLQNMDKQTGGGTNLAPTFEEQNKLIEKRKTIATALVEKQKQVNSFDEYAIAINNKVYNTRVKELNVLQQQSLENERQIQLGEEAYRNEIKKLEILNRQKLAAVEITQGIEAGAKSIENIFTKDPNAFKFENQDLARGSQASLGLTARSRGIEKDTEGFRNFKTVITEAKDSYNVMRASLGVTPNKETLAYFEAYNEQLTALVSLTQAIETKAGQKAIDAALQAVESATKKVQEKLQAADKAEQERDKKQTQRDAAKSKAEQERLRAIQRIEEWEKKAEDRKLNTYKVELQNLENLAKLEKEREGFISKASQEDIIRNKQQIIEQEKAVALAQLDADLAEAKRGAKGNKKLEEDIRQVAKGMTAEIEQQYQIKLKTLAVDEQLAEIARRKAEFEMTVSAPARRVLETKQSELEAANTLGILSPEQYVQSKYKNDLAQIQIERAAVLEQPAGMQRTGQLADLEVREKKLKIEKDTTEELRRREVVLGNLTTQENLIASILEKQEGRGIFNIELIDELANTKLAKITEQFNNTSDELQKQQLILEAMNVEYDRQLRIHEAMKRSFESLTADQMAQTVVNEATIQMDKFRASLKDTVTGTFEAVYAGFDAGIDELTTKIMEGSEIKFKDLITTVRNSMAEEFRKLAADQMKLGVRQIGASIMQAVTGKPTDLRTIEQQQLGYLQQIAANTSTMAMGQSFGGSSIFDYAQEGGKSVSYDLEGKMKVFDETSKTWVESTDQAAKQVAGITNGVLGNFGSTVMGVFDGLSGGILGMLQPILSLLGISIPGGAGGISGFGGIIGSALSSLGGFDLTGALGSVFGTSGIGGFISGLPSFFGFANGGVMSEYGPLKLNKYANGGIASTPQLALYGEGRKNEAYVPLPDNRTIPVTLNGAQGGDNISFSITVNDNSTVTTSQEGESSNKQRQQGYQDFSKLIAQKVREEMVNQKRPGGLLYGG